MINFFKGEFGVLTWAIALVCFTTATPVAAQTIGMVVDGAFDAVGTPTASGVHVFNADTRQVLASLPTTADAGDCSISADGSTGYFTRIDNMLQTVDLINLQLGSPIELSTNPAQDTALSNDGSFLVICDGAGTAQPITVVDTTTNPVPTIASTFQPFDASGETSCTAVAVCDNNDVLITTKGAIPDVQRLRLDEFGVLRDSRVLIDRGIDAEPDVPPGPALEGLASAMNAAGSRVYVRSRLNPFVDPSSCSSPLSGVPTDEFCGLIEVHEYDATTGQLGDTTDPDDDPLPVVFGPIRIETQGFGIDSIALHPDGTQLFVSEHAGYDSDFAPTGTPAAVNVYNTDGSFEGPLSDIADGVTPSTAIKAPTGICFGPIGDVGGPLAFAAYDGSVQILLLDGDLNDTVFLNTTLTLGVGNDGFDLDEEELTIQVEGVSVTIDAGSFERKTTKKKDFFKFDGVIDGVTVELKIDILGGGDSFTFKASLAGVTLDSTDPVDVTLTIGDDGGTFEALVLFI